MLSRLVIITSLFFLNTAYAEPTLKQLGPAPLFSGTSETGAKINNSSFLGKYLVINFFFTSCQGPCPVLMEQVRKLAEELPNKDLNFVSFSVDPDTDTPEVIAKYRAKRNLTDPRIFLLRNSREEVYKLLNEGFKLGSGEDPVNHSTRFVLVDKSGNVRALFNGGYSELKDLVEKLVQ